MYFVSHAQILLNMDTRLKHVFIKSSRPTPARIFTRVRSCIITIIFIIVVYN